MRISQRSGARRADCCWIVSNIEDAERRAECIQDVLNPSESLTEEVQADLDPVPVTDTPPPTDHTAPLPEHDEEPEHLPVDEEESGSPPAQDATPYPKEPETPVETATLMDELPVETEIAPTSAIDEPAVELPDYVEVEERPMTRRERRRARRAQSEDPSVTTYQGTYIKLPRRFEATITAAQNLVRGRQLIALDGYLVFVAEQREKGMLKIGDTVKVVRSSRFTDTRFSLTGNAGIVLATRVPCEKRDLSKESRIRCQILN